MVGGKVIGLARGDESTLLHIQDTRHARDDRCSIRVIEKRLDNGEPVTIAIGDDIWWQMYQAMWTPVPRGQGGCGESWDIHLRKVGYSH